MEQFFTTHYTGTASHLFDRAHLTVIGIVILVNLLIWSLRSRFTPQIRGHFRYGLATVLLVNEIGYHLWRWMTGTWTIQTMLPLHLCSVLVWTSIIMLFTRNFTIYEFIYFLGIGGATQAVLTPEADTMIFGFPHFRFFQSFIAHGIIVTSAIYMTVVERYRPYWKSLLRVIIITNVYMLFVGGVNALIGSNYLYIAHKPEMPTLIDVLGPWPWYILAMEGIGVFLCLLLYLPFAIKDRKNDSADPNKRA